MIRFSHKNGVGQKQCVLETRSLLKLSGAQNGSLFVPKESWCVYDPKKKQGTLSVTFINGFLNVIRCQIKDTGALLSSEDYYQKLKDIKIDKLKEYKSSQYNKMSNAIYSEYIKCKDSI